MTEDEGPQPPRDYMRQQIALPREARENGATAAPETEPEVADEVVVAAEAATSDSAPLDHAESFVDEPADGDHEDHDEPVPMPEEPPQYDPPPLRDRASYGPSSWEPAGTRPLGDRWRPDPSVNLGQATRAIQRRLPNALTYYRRDGVSSAVWAGVATSVAVTAAVWLLTRSSR